MSENSMYQIAVSVGVECAKSCADSGEKHNGAPIWPGDYEALAERFNATKHTVESKFTRDEWRVILKGFRQGVAQYGETNV